ncbi:hypothetical protein AGMMS49957_17620 [Synergistales bacterium]|nr:hypothetical protein AGMMS49957_17620 [Synergistales bacterium]
MRVLKKFTKFLYKIVEAFSVFFVLGMVVTVCYVVFCRYILNDSPRWGEEVALECMVWFSMLSASLAIWDNRHIRVTCWDMVLSRPALRALELIVHVILLGIIGMLFYYSMPLLKLVAPSKMSGTGISYVWMYGAVPVACVFMVIATIERIGEIYGGKS